MLDNIILKTDSYKLTHWPQYPAGTEYVYSYFEARDGALFDEVLWVGLQYNIEKYLAGQVITQEKIDEAEEIVAIHMGSKDLFNREGWEYILKEHNGYLPVAIKAVPEGTIVPVSNVLMTVVNTDSKCFWLTNYLETLLSHVWYPSTVATLSKQTKNLMSKYIVETGGDVDNVINFMLHDFGYRGVSSDESAAVGGMAHLVNFMGTDTIAALELAHHYYDADYQSLAFSVVATEHSIMTSMGPDVGEDKVIENLLDNFKTGILSVVADSYDIYEFTRKISTQYRDEILNRDGRFVLRPDSITPEHNTPDKLVVALLDILWTGFGGTVNEKQYKVLDDHIRIIWGDGIDIVGIGLILAAMKNAGYAAENIVFGMGGGLLQKVNRDTMRFAFKSSAQCRGGIWHNIQKNPLDQSKKSKVGKLALMRTSDGFQTVSLDPNKLGWRAELDEMRLVFRDGKMYNRSTFDEIRERSNR